MNRNYDMPMIGLQQMVIFVTVAELNGFAHAAGALHMTQSAVSKAVARLEEELGFKLFSRSTRYLELTEAGRALYEDWKIFLSAFENSYRKTKSLAKERTDLLRIGLMNTARPEGYFYPVLTAFAQRFPDVQYEVESQYMTDLESALEQGQFDVVLLPDFTRFYIEERNLSWRYFALDHARLIMSKNHPLAKRKSLKTKDLLDLKFVTVSTFTEDKEYLQDLSERLLPYGKQPNVAHIYKTAYDIRYLFRADDSVLLVDAYFDFSKDTSDFVILPVTDQKNGAICVWNPANKNEALENFLHIVLETTEK